MTTQSIEINLPSNTALIVFDPFVFNPEDLRNIIPGQLNIIRVRRPFWGNEDAFNHIRIITQGESSND